MSNKPIVFVITPFGEDYIALYDELKGTYENEFEFTNGGDLDNQQNILQDIVEGIYRADVVIADLTGLNPNVFYELGLAHALNKKVIIITQDLSELPFDIRSYRANEYSLQFNKLPKLKEELTKLLNGAIDNSVKYGNPVFDYIPQLENINGDKCSINLFNNKRKVEEEMKNDEEEGERGVIDFIADIEENSVQMTTELNAIGSELQEMNDSVVTASNEINRVNENSGSVDAAYTRKVCRKLAGPIYDFSENLGNHVENIALRWSIVENSYLSLLDSSYIHTKDNTSSLINSITSLEGMQEEVKSSNKQVEEFAGVLRSSMGIERRLNNAMASLIKQLDNYLSMTGTIISSVDRIISKSKIVIEGFDRVGVNREA